ncbi:hypothetical protein ABK040_016692 [Willaertia magna]
MKKFFHSRNASEGGLVNNTTDHSIDNNVDNNTNHHSDQQDDNTTNQHPHDNNQLTTTNTQNTQNTQENKFKLEAYDKELEKIFTIKEIPILETEISLGMLKKSNLYFCKENILIKKKKIIIPLQKLTTLQCDGKLLNCNDSDNNNYIWKFKNIEICTSLFLLIREFYFILFDKEFPKMEMKDKNRELSLPYLNFNENGENSENKEKSGIVSKFLGKTIVNYNVLFLLKEGHYVEGILSLQKNSIKYYNTELKFSDMTQFIICNLPFHFQMKFNKTTVTFIVRNYTDFLQNLQKKTNVTFEYSPKAKKSKVNGGWFDDEKITTNSSAPVIKMGGIGLSVNNGSGNKLPVMGMMPMIKTEQKWERKTISEMENSGTNNGTESHTKKPVTTSALTPELTKNRSGSASGSNSSSVQTPPPPLVNQREATSEDGKIVHLNLTRAKKPASKNTKQRKPPSKKQAETKKAISNLEIPKQEKQSGTVVDIFGKLEEKQVVKKIIVKLEVGEDGKIIVNLSH